MYTLLIIVLTIIGLLVFVPLERFAHAQTWVKDKIKEIRSN